MEHEYWIYKLSRGRSAREAGSAASLPGVLRLRSAGASLRSGWHSWGRHSRELRAARCWHTLLVFARGS